MASVPSEDNFVIKDLDSGRHYVWSPNASGDQATAGGAVTDATSGEQLSMLDFDRKLGIHVPQSSVNRQDSASSNDASSPKASDGQEHGTLRGPHGFLKMKNLKGLKTLWRSHSPISNSRQDGQPDSPESSPGGTPSSMGASGRSAFQTDDNEPCILSPLPPTPVGPALDQSDSPLGKSIASSTSIKIGQSRRSVRHISGLHLVQELTAHQRVVWTVRFSPDGSLLASGGKDGLVCLWEVISNRGANGNENKRVDLPVFRQEPVRLWKGHTSDILDVAWSTESQFVLSASMDKCVRMWHITKDQSLRQFQHQNWVTSIKFHPKDAGQFISGGGDGLLRMWNVMERRVVASASIASDNDMYTALCFSEDAKMIATGTYKGKCRIYEVNGKRIEKRAQIDVRNRRGRHSRGKRITGMHYLPGHQQLLLVTSNDSRIRLFQGLTEVWKFKGHSNNRGLPISASHSTRGDYIICGSDDGRVYVWAYHAAKPAEDENTSKDDTHIPSTVFREKVSAYEWFQGHEGPATVALFAPDTCRRPDEDLDALAETCTKSTSQRLRRHVRNATSGLPPTPSAAAPEAHSCGQEVTNGDQNEATGLLGQVIVTAGEDGVIRVWENFGIPANPSC